MANLLLDLDFDDSSTPAAPAQGYSHQQSQYGGGAADPFENFGAQMNSALPNPSSSGTHDRRYSDEEDDYNRGTSRDGRGSSRYSDEDDYDGGKARGSSSRDDGGKIKLNFTIAKPGEKREPARRASGAKVQRSVAGGARAPSPDRGGRSRYDDDDDKYRGDSYGSSSRNKYDDYEDDPDYGRGSSKDRYGGFGGSSSKRNDDDEDDGGAYYGRGSSGRTSGGSRSKDPYDSGYGGGYGGGSSYDRPESYRCYRARAWESYENDITGMEYAVDKTPENRIRFTLERDGMRVERESDGREMFYDYRNIAKINHKHGSGDNYLNFLMKDDRMITISTPDTVEIKKRLLERVKYSAGLKLGNYKSSRDRAYNNW